MNGPLYRQDNFDRALTLLDVVRNASKYEKALKELSRHSAVPGKLNQIDKELESATLKHKEADDLLTGAREEAKTIKSRAKSAHNAKLIKLKAQEDALESRETALSAAQGDLKREIAVFKVEKEKWQKKLDAAQEKWTEAEKLAERSNALIAENESKRERLRAALQ